MTLAPGYYWIRWPGLDGMHEWVPCIVEQGWYSGQVAVIVGCDREYDLDGAEIGTRIEPPLPTGDVKLGERVRGMLIALSDEERVSALSDADICHHCGKDMRASSRPYCSCTNDE
jgi:hypothetical protein